MNRNQLYVVIVVLTVLVVALAAYVIHQQTRPSGVEIRIDETGISVEEN